MRFVPSLFSNPMLLWAVKDLLRRPADSLLVFCSLTTLVTLVGAGLLLTHSVNATARRVLSKAPALIVRGLHPTGWAPIPQTEAVRRATAVVGVIKATPRIWGIVEGPGAPLTVIGIGRPEGRGWLTDQRLTPPGRNQAVVGPGVAEMQPPTDALTLKGACELTVSISGRLPPELGFVAQDVVLLHPGDARCLLGLADGFASDLAVDVFHPEEAEAIVSDLTAAFPWPVRITTRDEAAALYTGGTARYGGVFLLAALPSILAMGYLIAGTLRDRFGRLYEAGLLKAVGWTSSDIVKLWAIRALTLCAPAVLVGIGLAFSLVFWPGVSWPARFFFGWTETPPQLYLSWQGGLTAVLTLIGLVVAPYLAAALMPAFNAAVAEPQTLLEKDLT